MPEIAQSGYSSVQVSPISACYKSSDGEHAWQWADTYMPTDFTIGNYVVGTKDEFIELNKEAKKYGIKIIVDVVANHLSPYRNKINPDLWNDKTLFHNKGFINDWSDRCQITQNDILNIPDLNTQNPKVQNMVIDYLKECMDCGADGFRFDTIKHIELPDDEGFGGDFWPNVINAIKSYKPNAFIYGDTIQQPNDKVSRYSAYSKYMNLMGDFYSDEVRREINVNINSGSTMILYK